MSLGVIIVSMVVATVASLVASARDKKAGTVESAKAVADEKGTPATVDDAAAERGAVAGTAPAEPAARADDTSSTPPGTH